MTHDSEIRPARKSDLDGLLALYRHLNRSDPTLEADAAKTIWDDLLGRPGITIYLAEKAGQLVGSCMLIVVPNLTRGGRPYALIENVVTHEAHRGRGIGQAVLRAAIEHAWHENCYKIMLMTGRKDEAINLFYEKAGFSRDGKTAFTLRRD